MAFILFICINGVSAICKFYRLNAVKAVTSRTAFSPQKQPIKAPPNDHRMSLFGVMRRASCPKLPFLAQSGCRTDGPVGGSASQRSDLETTASQGGRHRADPAETGAKNSEPLFQFSAVRSIWTCLSAVCRPINSSMNGATASSFCKSPVIRIMESLSGKTDLFSSSWRRGPSSKKVRRSSSRALPKCWRPSA